MAPVTRARVGSDGVPTALTAQYYRQRASAGLIITEATNVSPMSSAFENAPGLYHSDQAAGWREVYSVKEGFEGPLDERDRRSTLGGWRLAGLPWEQL